MLTSILKKCLSFIKNEEEDPNLHLHIMRVYHKTSFLDTNHINDIFRPFALEQKVVISSIPVLALKEPDVFLTITGLC